MITVKQAMETPELMIKHKDDLKNERIFEDPWYWVFWKHPYLYREFSDRFDKMDGWDVAYALRDDPTLISDLKDYLHKMDRADISHALRDNPTLIPYFKDYLHKIQKKDVGWVLLECPELFLCLKHKDNPDKAEAAYYITFPHRLDDLNKEEKREMVKRIIELLREEKM